MNTTDLLNGRYLDTVERAAAAPPARAHAELIADLADRITTALVARPGELTVILQDIGDPREVGAAAVRRNDPTAAPSG
ncbi:hypothetical protein [Streptomyces longwoodensis]|uniref:hypothetical protein n=1 Tax=Streptomyces longwoodensis TaxID=68231 RepID=UPI00380E1D12